MSSSDPRVSTPDQHKISPTTGSSLTRVGPPPPSQQRTHADDEDKKPYTEGLPWPWEVQHDAKGRAYYLNHEDKTSSWLNPAKLELFKTHGTLEGNIYEGCGEGAYCVVEEKTVGGESYWVNYTVGEVGGPDRQEDPPAPGA